MLVSAIHQHESVIRTPMSPPSWTSLPPPTPLGCHRALGLSSQHHIANSHWLFCFMCGKVYGLEKENGNPLQYSCLENPVDRGSWWAAVYGVAQSRTRLKWLNSSSISKVYVSMLLSQFIPPSPSPTVPYVCSLCLCLHWGYYFLMPWLFGYRFESTSPWLQCLCSFWNTRLPLKIPYHTVSLWLLFKKKVFSFIYLFGWTGS